MKKIILTLSLILCFFVFINAQETNPAVSTKEQLAESVKLAPCNSKERLEAVKKLFVSVGAKEEDVTIENFKDISNVVVKKKGKTDETIIIGAHYDKTDMRCGAIDNWTGISILAHLFKTFSYFQTEKSYIFVAFDKEEIGLLGSEAMAKAIPKEERKNYCSMVNIDSFGQALPQSLYTISSSKLIKFAKEVSKNTNIKFEEINIEGASSDSKSFRDKGIPAISFSGLGGDWKNYLHTSSDKIENVNMDSVYLGYRFVLSFTAKLDVEGCQIFR